MRERGGERERVERGGGRGRGGRVRGGETVERE